MKIEYDRGVDALYIRLQERYVARTVEVEEGVNLDFDETGKFIGLEVLDATDKVQSRRHLQFVHGEPRSGFRIRRRRSLRRPDLSTREGNAIAQRAAHCHR